MYDLFGALQSRILKRSAIVTDNAVFKLHYRLSVVLLAAFSLIVTGRQYIGDPIDCMSQTSDIPGKMLDQYCWISSTFTLPSAFDRRIGVEVPQPGIDKSVPGEDRIYHQYYQWVCFVLFLQAAMFYVPRYVWKIWEGGRMKALGLDMPLTSDDDYRVRKDVIVSYFVARHNNHGFYFGRYFVCELLNLINVVGQIFFTDRFLGGAFTTYGSEVIRFSEMDHNERTDPMMKIFPRVTKCLFYTFGSSGDVQKHDALCILPLNIINEKIYIFLWFWFIILAAISGLAVLYHSVAFFCPHFRFLLLRLKSSISPREYLNSLNRKLLIGDWFVLYQVGKSVDSRLYAAVIAELAKKLDGKDDVRQNCV